MHEGAPEQRHLVDGLDGTQVALRPAQDVPSQTRGVAHSDVCGTWSAGGVGVAVHHGDDLALVLCLCIRLRRDAELLTGVGSGVFAGNVPLAPAGTEDQAAALARILCRGVLLHGRQDVLEHDQLLAMIETAGKPPKGNWLPAPKRDSHDRYRPAHWSFDGSSVG